MGTFKDIKGYEGIYQISDNGEVFVIPHFDKLKRKQGGMIRRHKLLNGYKVVGLFKEGKYVNHHIHRLIAEAFIPNPQNKRCINHIDGNPQNNQISNLEWCTHSENSLHAWKTGLRKMTDDYRTHLKTLANKQRKLSEEQVKMLRFLYSIGTPIRALSNIYGINQKTVTNIINLKHYKIAA